MMPNSTNNSSVRMEQILEFELLFPNEKPLPVERYLKGGSRSVILNSAAFFLGFKAINSKYEDVRELLHDLFGKQNNEFANEIYNRIKEIQKTVNRLTIINSYSSLRLFELFFQQEEDERTQTDDEFEINLFKAYLVLNSEFLTIQKVAFTSTEELDSDLKFPMMIFCSSYPLADKMNYSIDQIWTTQVIKAIYFFQFIEKESKLLPLLNSFLAHFNCKTWQDYVKKLMPLTFPAIKGQKEAHTDITVTPNENFDDACDFIEKLIVIPSDELEESDFISLRAKPFYKISKGLYRVIFNLFVVEKIFKGLYFLLSEVNEKLPEGQMISNLKSIIGLEFSEHILLNNILNIIYPDGCLKFSGKQMDKMRIDGAPDFYIRKGKSILLFESKDFLIKAANKNSFDFNIYEEEFEQKLYYVELENGRKKPKAVLQLINSLRKLLKREFNVDTDYQVKDVYIYPVLVIHDHQFDTPGFNYLINFWFQYELLGLQEEGLFIHHVKPLVVINIDTLIYHQVGLTEDSLLHEVIDDYENQIKIMPAKKFKNVEEKESYLLSRLTPFSTFTHNFFIKKGIKKLPPILALVKPALFEGEM